MKQTNFKCDRCGAKDQTTADHRLPSGWKVLRLSDGFSYDSIDPVFMRHLCNDCVASLVDEWFNSETSSRRKFKIHRS